MISSLKKPIQLQINNIPMELDAIPRNQLWKSMQTCPPSSPGLPPIYSFTISSKLMLHKAFEDDNKKSIFQYSLLKSLRPKLILIARKGSRVFLNQREIVKVAGKLGFRVMILSPNVNTQLKDMNKIINSRDVFIGIHGAALTHFLFLPPEGRGRFVHVVPLRIEWDSQTLFKGLATKMDAVEYLEYQILPQEGSLYDEYPKDHLYLRDPKSVNRKGWNATKKVYMDMQKERRIYELRSLPPAVMKVEPLDSLAQ